MDKEGKGLKWFSAFEIIFSLICVAVAIIYAIFENINRFSEPNQIIISLGFTGIGILGALAGLNMLFSLELESKFIMLLGFILSASGILGFILFYPDTWFYPKVAYVILAYAAGIFLLACNVLLQQLKSIYVPMNCKARIENSESDNNIFFGEGQLTAAVGSMMFSQILYPPSEFHMWNASLSNQNISQTNADLFLDQTEEINADLVGSLVEMKIEVLNETYPESDDVGPTTKTTANDRISDAFTIKDSDYEHNPAAEETQSIPPVIDTDMEVKSKEIESVSAMKKTDIRQDDYMQEAARKILRFHFGRMLKHERGTMIGKDIEELHDMRVAAMRMRSVFQVFNGHLDMELMKPHLRNLKTTRRSLGTVRDLDVFMEKIQHYIGSLPEQRKSELDGLIETLMIERDKSRGIMLLHLDSDRYNKFKLKFTKILEKKKGWEGFHVGKDSRPIPNKVRDILPLLLYNQLATVRTYDDLIDSDEISSEMLHSLRIDIKILRYTLEFFEEVMGEDTISLIKDLKALQDNLGDIHDAVVATELLENYLKYGKWGIVENEKSEKETAMVIDIGIENYLAYRRDEIGMLLETFPILWSKIMDANFGIRLSGAVSSIYQN